MVRGDRVTKVVWGRPKPERSKSKIFRFISSLSLNPQRFFMDDQMRKEVPIHALTLEFHNDPSLEQNYQQLSNRSEVVMMERVWLLVILISLLLIVFDAYTIYDRSSQIFFLRCGLRIISCVIFWAPFAVVRYLPDRMPKLKKYLTIVYIAGGIVYILIERRRCIYLMDDLIAADFNDSDDVAIILIVAALQISSVIIARLGYLQVFTVCLSLTISYTVTGSVMHIFRDTTIAIETTILMIINALLSAGGAYRLEMYSRLRFLQIRKQNKTTYELSQRVMELEDRLGGDDEMDIKDVKSSIETVIDKLRDVALNVENRKHALAIEQVIGIISSRGQNLWAPDMNNLQQAILSPNEKQESAVYSLETQRFLLDHFFSDSKLILSEKDRLSRSEVMTPRVAADRYDVDLSFIVSYSVELPDFLQKNVGTWNMDVFQLDEISEHHPIQAIGLYLFHHLNFCSKFKISQEVLRNFLEQVESTYQDLQYHSAKHGADVTNSIWYFLQYGKMVSYLPSIEVMATIVSSLIHDVGHPGVNNNFLAATKSDKAILYNDLSILENYHVSTAYRILKDDRSDIFANLSTADWKSTRKFIIQCVLATDTSKHFETLSQLRTRIAANDFKPEYHEDRMFVCSMALRVSDIGHCAKELPLHIEWSKRVQEEFYRQGDLEKSLDLPVSAYCDRSNNDFNKSQHGFLDFICIPLFQSWASFLGSPKVDFETLDQVKSNRDHWKKQFAPESPAVATTVVRKHSKRSLTMPRNVRTDALLKVMKVTGSVSKNNLRALSSTVHFGATDSILPMDSSSVKQQHKSRRQSSASTSSPSSHDANLLVISDVDSEV
eukprot:GILJ01006243.1.p1 GENE.GILJ01006243.1~~GILJ01006243.1.p1  ORF type:complete len:834 (-),score=112.41 GILJ01006243.1:226-2727(-)